MVIKPVNTKEEARQQTIDWQTWQGEQNLSYLQCFIWQEYFRKTAEQFDLIEEFTENGII